MAVASTSEVRARASDATRWGQLIFGIICMVMIANLQYGWTLFVNPIDQKYHWGRAAIQVAFTIFVLAETWLVPIEGYLIDKFGPRAMISISGVLVALAWMLNAYADSLVLLYLGSANLTGAGLGAKADRRRNFEAGIWTESTALIDGVLERLDALWEGRHCAGCLRRDVCPVPLEEPRLGRGARD